MAAENDFVLTPVAVATRDRASGAPLGPKHPERICWGCNNYWLETDLACGSGTIGTPDPIELFGQDWLTRSTERSRHVDALAP